MTSLKSAIDTAWQTNITNAEAASNDNQRFNLYRSLGMLGRNVRMSITPNAQRPGPSFPVYPPYPYPNQRQDQSSWA